jgi:hypothetical protein
MLKDEQRIRLPAVHVSTLCIVAGRKSSTITINIENAGR